ncbi:MAG: nitrilase-related carbon-nitrogen hydrolase [Verrucomicrobiota bacterium]
MIVTLCQWDLAWENAAANFESLEQLLDGMACGDLLVLPEMFASGFSFDVEKTVPIGRQSADYLQGLSKGRDVAIIGGLVERDETGQAVNLARGYDRHGHDWFCYQKNRTFRYSGETAVHQQGDEIVVTRLGDWQVCPLICYDLRFPELFRRATKRGAELFVVIANWPSARESHWVTLLQARAIENQAWVVAVNRTGSDPQLHYSGRSLIVNPLGKVVADLGGESLALQYSLDREELLNWRESFPALADLEI